MSDLRFNPRTIILILFILVITLFRLLVTFNSDAMSFANFSSMGAVAIFGAAYFKDQTKALVFTLASLFLSDFILAATLYKEFSNGFLYEGWFYTYFAFGLMVLASRLIMRRVNALSFLGSTLVIVFIHWIVTDFGVWYNNPGFTQDFSGFMLCLTKAIPFELRFLGGTLGYGALMFGAFELLKVKFPALKTAKA